MKSKFKNQDENTIYGRNVILELLKSEECNIEEIFIQNGIHKSFIDELMKLLKTKDIKITKLNKKEFEDINNGQKTQGVMAKIAPYEYSSLEQILKFTEDKKEDPFLLILDGIEDPHNLGAIIRSSVAFGVHGIILPGRRSVHVNSTVFKSSSGMVSYARICLETNLNNTIDFLKKRGFWIYGSDANASGLSSDGNYEGPVALIIGNEGKGISRLTREKCDILIKVPIFGRAESLNASVAAGILMYDISKFKNLQSPV